MVHIADLPEVEHYLLHWPELVNSERSLVNQPIVGMNRYGRQSIPIGADRRFSGYPINRLHVSDFVLALWKSGLVIWKNGDPLGSVPIAYAGVIK